MTDTGVAPARWLPGWFVSPRGFRESVGLSLLSGSAELGASILANLAVPLVASTMAYAGYRTIALYSFFVGALHLGFADGLYLEALGKPLASVDSQVLRRVVLSVTWLQLTLIPLLGVVLASTPRLWHYDRVSLAIALVGYGASNVAVTYASLWKATGLFRCLTASSLLGRMASILVLVPALASGRAPLAVLAVTVSVFSVTSAMLQHSFIQSVEPLPGPEIPPGTVARLLRRGLPLYASNLSVLLLFNFDTLTVSVFFPPESFATYAFAFGLTSITYTVADSMTAATAFSIARSVRSSSVRPDPTFVPYVASLWGGPVVYWAGSALISFAYPRFSEAAPLLLIFGTALPFGLLLRSRALAEASALARERKLASATGGGLGMVVLAVAVGVAVGRDLQGVAIGWAVGTFLASILAIQSSGTERRLLGHAFGVSGSFVGCAVGIGGAAGAALFLCLAVTATGLEIRRARQPGARQP